MDVRADRTRIALLDLSGHLAPLSANLSVAAFLGQAERYSQGNPQGIGCFPMLGSRALCWAPRPFPWQTQVRHRANKQS
jgi:hypothetical protein